MSAWSSIAVADSSTFRAPSKRGDRTTSSDVASATWHLCACGADNV